jgi:enoyl-CoA hydratase/carnithine racemase
MCFAAAGKAIFCHPEVAIRLVPGGATQGLPRLVGRDRALEVLLGCNDFSAELAERYGYINRALPADELTPFVEKLACRIASFPAHAIAHEKAAVDSGPFSAPRSDGASQRRHWAPLPDLHRGPYPVPDLVTNCANTGTVRDWLSL